MSPDLLTLIRRACDGTAAEGLAPKIMDLPVCVATCRHFTGPWCDIDRGEVCEPAVEALARLAVSQAAEVERLTEALRVATVSPPLPPNGCEPAAVKRVELVWQRSPAGSYWTLGEQGEEWSVAPYGGHETGIAESRPSGTHCHCDSWPAACRWIADRARADGYRVPPHPLGWDVGGDL